MAKKGTNTKEKILANTEALFLEKGYSGTAIDDILGATGITKGAFFYHFKSKAELARTLVERYAANDFELFLQFQRRADELSDDPLQSTLIFLKLFEEFVDGLDNPPSGCIFASYLYESKHFDDTIKMFIQESFLAWQGLYEKRFEAILKKYPAKVKVEAKNLAETIICIIEGSFILGKSLQDPKLIIRTSQQFRCYLQILFDQSL